MVPGGLCFRTRERNAGTGHRLRGLYRLAPQRGAARRRARRRRDRLLHGQLRALPQAREPGARQGVGLVRARAARPRDAPWRGWSPTRRDLPPRRRARRPFQLGAALRALPAAQRARHLERGSPAGPRRARRRCWSTGCSTSSSCTPTRRSRRLEESVSPGDALRVPVHHTGFVGAAAGGRGRGASERIVVSAGGGRVGAPLPGGGDGAHAAPPASTALVARSLAVAEAA